MPKPKATEVIVHRFDLQPSLKESVDAFLIGKTATNALSAVGSVLSAFGPALGALVAAWIAKEGIEVAVDKVTGYFEKKGRQYVEERYGTEMEKYKLVFATIQSCTSPEQFTEVHSNMMEQLSGGVEFVKKAWVRFLLKRGTWMENEATWPTEVARAWKAFYPPSALINEVKGDVQETIDTVLPWPLNLLY